MDPSDILEGLTTPVWGVIGTGTVVATSWIGRKTVVRLYRWAHAFAAIPTTLNHVVDRLADIETKAAFKEIVDEVLAANGRYAIARCDEHGCNTYVSDNYAKMLGCVPGDLIGRGWERFIATERREQYAREWGPAMEFGRTFEFELTYTHADGSDVPVLIRSYKVQTNDIARGYVVIITPIEKQ